MNIEKAFRSQSESTEHNHEGDENDIPAVTKKKKQYSSRFLDHLFQIIGLILAMAAIVTGIWIPIALDTYANKRAKKDVCTTAILSLRADLNALQSGYEIDRSAKPLRISDWGEAANSIDLVQVSCSYVTVDDGPLLEMIISTPEDSKSYMDHRSAFKIHYDKRQSGLWDTDNSSEVQSFVLWTGYAIQKTFEK